MKGFAILFIFLTACGQSSGSCPEADNTPFTREQKVIVNESGFQRMSEEIPEGTEFTVLIDHSCRADLRNISFFSEKFPEGDAIRSHSWKTESALTMTDLQSLVRDDECVIGIGRAPSIEMLDTDPGLSKQDQLVSTKALKASALFFDSSKGIKQDVVIAVIDTGVDAEHEDLRENIWINLGEISGNGKDDDKNGYVDDIHGFNFASKVGDARPEGGKYHGTHVAGLAAARYGNGRGGSGIMGRRLKIMSLNVFGKSTGALTSNIDNAIRYAADNGAQVINLSIGGRGSAATTEAAIGYAIKKGVTVLAAAGNENKKLDSSYFMTPGSYGPKFSGMMAVGSIDTSTNTRSIFSNYSPTVVEIAAPGAVNSKDRLGLYSTLLNGKYGRAQGTSMSSPVAAGVAALAAGLVKSRGFHPAPAVVEKLLWESGREIKALAGIFKGRTVDAEKLYEVIDKKYPMKKEAADPFPESPGLPPTILAARCSL